MIDTNVFLWIVMEPRRLSPRVRSLVTSHEPEILVSAVTPWELAIKVARNKLLLPTTLEGLYRSAMDELGAIELPIKSNHGLAAARIPRLHGDPFDRMLVAQATIEGVALVTSDVRIRDYGIEVIW